MYFVPWFSSLIYKYTLQTIHSSITDESGTFTAATSGLNEDTSEVTLHTTSCTQTDEVTCVEKGVQVETNLGEDGLRQTIRNLKYKLQELIKENEKYENIIAAVTNQWNTAYVKAIHDICVKFSGFFFANSIQGYKYRQASKAMAGGRYN